MASASLDIESFKDLANDDDRFNDRCIQIARDIHEGRCSIVEIVEALGPLLTDANHAQREKGTLILSNILSKLPNDFLKETELNFICTFFADRLKDHHQVVPAVLKGILALTNYKNVPQGSATQLLQNLFQYVPCQQQQQPDRLCIYSIFKGFLNSKLTEIQAMSFDFVYGVISAMDGERDPKNLIFLFQWLPSFVKSVTLGHLTEEMFEVMACYFPVDFRAPAQDPNRISREELAVALCPCLCAIPEFGQFCLPLTLEKLTSSLRVAKMDSLDLMIEGCKTFNAEIYHQHMTEIWSAIQTEIFNNSKDTELEEACLNTLACILQKLSETENQNGFIDNIKDRISLMKGNLLPDNRLFEPTTKFLVSVCKGSKNAADYVAKDILPLMITTFVITETLEHQIKIFEQFVEFIDKTYPYIVKDNEDVRRQVVEQCLRASIHVDGTIRALGYDGLCLMLKCLEESEKRCVYENLKLLLLKPQLEKVRKSVLKCFRLLAGLHPEEVKKNLVDYLKPEGTFELEYYLDSLREIVTIPSFTNEILDIYLANIKNLDTSSLVFKYLRQILGAETNNESIYLYLLKERNILSVILDWTINNVHNVNIVDCTIVLDDINYILKYFIGSNYLDKADIDVSIHIKKIFDTYKMDKKWVCIVLLNGILCRLKRPISISDEIIENLMDVSIKCENRNICKYGTELLANIINKIEENTETNVLNKIESQCTEQLTTSNPDVINNSCQLISFTTKALYMKGSERSQKWLNKMVNLLTQHKEIAFGFFIVMNESYDSLSKESNCIIRLLYRQKFFIQSIAALGEAAELDNPNYMLSFGYLLKEVPYQILQPQFPKVVRFIIMTLQTCLDSEVLCGILEKLSEFIKNKDPQIEEYCLEFLAQFLTLAKYKTSMKVRIKALQCVQMYPAEFPIYKLVPHKQMVIYSLTETLDDPKRLVRKEAVVARSNWCLLDAPM